MIFVLAGLALLGFIASLSVHLFALAGIPTHVNFPFVWALHIGIFVVFIPAIFVGRRFMKQRNFWFTVLPRPLSVMLSLLFVYTFINFFLAIGTVRSGSWDVSTDQTAYTFSPKGGQPEASTKQEYMQAQASVDRMFSGHWMLFYFAAFSILLTATSPRQLA